MIYLFDIQQPKILKVKITIINSDVNISIDNKSIIFNITLTFIFKDYLFKSYEYKKFIIFCTTIITFFSKSGV